MKSILSQSLRAALIVLLLAAVAQTIAGDALPLMPRRLMTILLGALAVATLFAILLRRVRSEDRVARLEATLCREQNARSQADHALAEADLLLARLTARGRQRADDPEGQLAMQLIQIQAELAHLQQNSALDVASAERLSRARDRLDEVARLVRNAARAAQPG